MGIKSTKKPGFFARRRAAKAAAEQKWTDMKRTSNKTNVEGMTNRQKKKIVKNEAKVKAKKVINEAKFAEKATKKYGKNYERIQDEVMRSELKINEAKKLSNIRKSEFATKAFTTAGAFASGIGGTASSLSDSVEDLFTADSENTKYAWQS